VPRRRKYNKGVAAIWEEALYNITHVGKTVRSYSTSPYLLYKLGQVEKPSASEVSEAIATYAFGKCASRVCVDKGHAHGAWRSCVLIGNVKPTCECTARVSTSKHGVSCSWVASLACAWVRHHQLV
jgi:hydroxymethylpyrimidine/phosphomethylpyrimidine kinase